MELYNKYRPRTFDEILGNDEAIKSIKAELGAGHNAFLFVAEKGCGKTTTAECVARYLGVDELNIRMINASNERKIEDIRAIGEELRFAPLDNTKLVYILDECPGLTNDAQECLLRIVEKSPEWAVFIFATTNPEKLKEALRSRLSLVRFKPLDSDTMYRLLRVVTHKEGVSIDFDILKTIAAESQGSSRNALKRLGQVLYLANDEERKEFLKLNPNVDENEDAIELCRALIKQEGWNKYTECLEKLKDELETSSEGIRHLVMSYAISVLKKGMNPVAVAMLQAFSNADTYKNKGKAIWVAVLDYMSMLAG